jgi:hypothetical protein
MFLTLRPVGRGGRYAALVNDRTVAEGRTPIFSAGRALIQEGVCPQEPLIVSHEGNEIVSMTMTVGQAAQLTVIERDSGSIHIARYDADTTERLSSLQGGRQGAAFSIERHSAVVQPVTAFCDDYPA